MPCVLTISIADAEETRVLTAVCARHGYDAAADGSQTAFVKAKLIKWLQDNVAAYEAKAAVEDLPPITGVTPT